MVKGVNRKGKFALIFIGIIILSLALSYRYIQYIDMLLYQQNVSSIVEVTDQGAKRIEYILQNNLSILNRKAQDVGTLYLTGRENNSLAMRYILEVTPNDDYYIISLVTPDGKAKDMNGNVLDVSDEPYFKKALNEGKSFISEPFYEEVENKKVLALYTPVIVENETKAVLRSAILADDLYQLFHVSFFSDQGYCYILNRKGELLIGSPHNGIIGDFKNLFQLLAGENKTKEELKNMQADFADGRQGTCILHSGGVGKFFSYLPLENAAEWYLVTVVEEKVITQNTRTVILYSIAMCALLTFVLLGVSLTFILERQRKRVARLEHTAYKDTLTGLYNRNYLAEKTAAILEMAMKKKMASAVVDVDKFKMINESFGYCHGDIILSYVASAFMNFMEKDEFAVRLKDDLFVLILCYENEKDLEERLLHIFENIRKGFTQNQLINSISFSCGVYLLQGLSSASSNLFDYGDIARKSVKQHSDTKIAFFKKSMLWHLQEEKEMEDRMEYALHHGEFALYLQPKFDMQTGEMNGAEALVRWISQTKGIVGPGRFIPLFEKNGFITKLDYYMFEKICQLKQSWKEKNMPDPIISVNMSRNHLSQDDFIVTLVAIADRYGIHHETIEIEITESAFFNDTERLIDMMLELKGAGFKLSMDDFGAGYSSLNLLKKLPIDVLKIDKDFLDESEVTPKGQIIMSSIVKMAQNIKVEVICEGVETQKQVNFLLGIGCLYGQGYLYARPMKVQEFEEFRKNSPQNKFGEKPNVV